MASLPSWLTNIKYVFLISWLLRAALIVYGHLQDNVLNVKFTDIDYHVFTDAAGHVLEGRPPYHRPTYRYTPLIAWLLVPNHILHISAGKVIFISLDILAGWMIYKILALRGQSEPVKVLSCAFWLFNPLTAVVSSRGNAESTMSVLMLMCLYYLMSDSITTSAILYGAAVHVKIYPIIHCLAFYLVVDSSPWGRDRATGKFKIHWRLLISRRRVLFTVLSSGTFLMLTSFFYLLYGWEFLHETYFYHLTRTDVRHNFSIYFYVLYLAQKTWVAPLVSSFAFLPQLLLIPTSSFRLFQDPPFLCFIQTFIFVTFNKVCTSQYFLWYLCYLPLILPYTQLSLKEGLLMIISWFITQGLWLLSAYLLEFQDMDTYIFIWLSSCLFFITNVWIITRMMLKHIIMKQKVTIDKLDKFD